MTHIQDWQDKYHTELSQAEQARLSGNEGMARVCARRAAGIVIGEYLRRCGIPDPGPSAYEQLKYIMTLPDVDDSIKEVASLFVLRVNEDHNLPLDVDLIAETHWLAHKLLTD